MLVCSFCVPEAQYDPKEPIYCVCVSRQMWGGGLLLMKPQTLPR